MRAPAPGGTPSPWRLAAPAGTGSLPSAPSLAPQVRTKDHRFESVSHLISYHMDNHLPIISAGSEMCLQQPVERRP